MKTKMMSLLLCCFFCGSAFSQPNQPGSGNCLEYDGVDDYVNVPDANSLDITNAITIEAWINMDVLPTPTNGSWPIVLKRRTTGANLPYKQDTINYVFTVIYNNAVRLHFLYRDVTGLANNYFTAPLAFNTNRWYHVAVSYTYGNGASVRIYLNGKDITAGGSWLTGNGNTPVNSNNYPVQIGRAHDCASGGTWFSNGQIDEVRAWNYARSQTEIREDMCRKLQGNEPGLVGYWRFDEGSGSTAFDSSPNGNDGTLQ